MQRPLIILPLIAVALTFVSCRASRNLPDQKGIPSLSKIFEGDFDVGTAFDSVQILTRNKKAAHVITCQFNALTPENAMKTENIHPEWDRYNFTQSDKIVAFAKKNGLKVNGHALVWHSQLPVFVHQINDTDSFRTFFENHIQTLAARYNGRIESWDVVNEALNEDGTFRKSVFLQMLGEDYIVEAFRLAQKAAPDTRLYYNDYNIEQPQKRAGTVRLIKKLQEAGVRIDGVGIQGHWRVNNIPFAEIEKSIQEFSALGVKVMFTELDLGVLQNPWDNNGAEVGKTSTYRAEMDPYNQGLPDSVAQFQASQYEKLFRLFLKYSKEISRVTFWGVNDGQSWLNDWPIPGRTNYPLLFDREFNPKAAFYRVVNLKRPM